MTDDIVVSSRVRLARNISKIPFPHKINKLNSQEIIGRISSLLPKSKFNLIRMDEINDVDKLWLIEKHLISTHLAGNLNGAVLINRVNNFSIMINEEDHIRSQAITRGFNLKDIFTLVNDIDNIFINNMPIAYSDRFGFLTACPSNIGTGMRASVMLFLPCLTLIGKINEIFQELSSYKVFVRGTFGEGSNASGYMYQLSNQITLNVSENQIINSVNNAAALVTQAENEARKLLINNNSAQLVDQILRSYGVLTNAYRLSISEFNKCYADLKLGIIIGVIKSINDLDNIYTSAQEAHISKASGFRFDDYLNKEIYRAKIVKEGIIKKR